MRSRRLDAVDLSTDQATGSEGPWNAKGQSARHERGTVSDDEPRDVSQSCADCDPNADLALALTHGTR